MKNSTYTLHHTLHQLHLEYRKAGIKLGALESARIKVENVDELYKLLQLYTLLNDALQTRIAKHASSISSAELMSILENFSHHTAFEGELTDHLKKLQADTQAIIHHKSSDSEAQSRQYLIQEIKGLLSHPSFAYAGITKKELP